MPTPESWQGEAERLSRYSHPPDGTEPPREEMKETGMFGAIGYALLETEHMPGFARRAPYFLRALAKAGYMVVKR